MSYSIDEYIDIDKGNFIYKHKLHIFVLLFHRFLPQFKSLSHACPNYIACGTRGVELLLHIEITMLLLLAMLRSCVRFIIMFMFFGGPAASLLFDRREFQINGFIVNILRPIRCELYRQCLKNTN